MNAPAEGAMVPGNADPAARWAEAFDMRASLPGKSARDAHPTSPVANAPRIVGSTILVGHSCQLVEMGLLVTLRRLTFYETATREELTALPPGTVGARNIDVVVADRALAGSLATFAAGLNRSAGRGAPKVLLIGADAESSSVLQDSPTAFDARLALGCRQQDLVDTLNALIESGGSEIPARAPQIPARDSTRCPAGNGKEAPDTRIITSGVGAATHLIEGIPLHAPRSPAANPPRGGLPPGALRRVREAMEQGLAEKLELTELAAVAGVSRCHFARAFKESVGQPPHRYLMMRRIEVAAEMIKDSDRTLTDISLDMGFFDQSHFVRVFTRIVGETPGAYRRKHR
ncbi:MAG TPA: AraC family transcriptional regulator [Burkholderiales bacterium]|nr:AraC family transcriptional regulator [Burkholderiales bacterium]